ncbi:MAG TPA: hypothetical protein VNJ03_16560 [Vicinamibacterales bacterium]|nr:hypothetical protein [Vicinamibacterales bacterium]
MTKKYAVLLMLALWPLALFADPGGRSQVAPQPQTAAAPKPFAVEYYYKVKWGHFEEFLDLYKKNHYPILQRYQKLGRIQSMSAAYPINHAGEATRWDFRFTIVWKDAATAHEEFDESSIVKELYPDQGTFKKEEQRRFELLVEHMDVPVALDDLKTWR